MGCVIIGADHAGFVLKEGLKKVLAEKGLEVIDAGTDNGEAVDYPDFAEPVAEEVYAGRVPRGILVCGSGIGMSIVANRFPGVRAALCLDEDTARMSRRHNDANVLVLAGRKTDLDTAEKIVAVWLETEFEGGRHQARLDKVAKVEKRIITRAEKEIPFGKRGPTGGCGIRKVRRGLMAKTISTQQYERPTWDEYFMDIVRLVSRRSTCLRRSVGAILVKDKRILATGYNGAPSGLRHCVEVGCLREKMNISSGERHELCRGLHAEQNAIIQSALHGVSLKDATLYSTNHPCVICAKMIINAGIARVYYAEGYRDRMAEEMLLEAGVEVAKI